MSEPEAPKAPRKPPLDGLVRIYLVKVVLTVAVWCGPLLVVPEVVAAAVGIEGIPALFLLRLLGWAYLALCVGYVFGLQAAWRAERRHGPLWAGIVSTGGACVLLSMIVVSGTHGPWAWQAQAIVFLSAAATALITIGLTWYAFGLDRLFNRRAPAAQVTEGTETPAEAEAKSSAADDSDPKELSTDSE